jgi:hypothetical protein
MTWCRPGILYGQNYTLFADEPPLCSNDTYRKCCGCGMYGWLRCCVSPPPSRPRSLSRPDKTSLYKTGRDWALKGEPASLYFPHDASPARWSSTLTATLPVVESAPERTC